jgi:hypothetical protein
MYVIYVQVFSDGFIYVVPFQCVQMFALPPRCYYVHSIRHCSVCMSGVQYVV